MEGVKRKYLTTGKPKTHNFSKPSDNNCKQNKSCLTVTKKGDHIPKLHYENQCENNVCGLQQKPCKTQKPPLHVIQHDSNKSNKCDEKNNSSSSTSEENRYDEVCNDDHHSNESSSTSSDHNKCECGECHKK